MKVKKGNGTSEFGKGIIIKLTGSEVATAISAYLVANGLHVNGPRTIKVNGESIDCGSIYIDPSGFVIKNGVKRSGRTGEKETSKEVFNRKSSLTNEDDFKWTT